MAETRKQTAKKTASKTARKSTAKKSSGTRSTATKATKKTTGSTTSKSASARGSSGSPRAAATTESRPQNRSSHNGTRPGPVGVAASALEQLAVLTGRPTEGVVGIERDDDQWVVEIEVLELRRIPNTTDVLARYRVTADDTGELTGYRRLQRYTRGAAGEE
jgi:Gas vesicle synthesis protein GvpO